MITVNIKVNPIVYNNQVAIKATKMYLCRKKYVYSPSDSLFEKY